MNGASPTVSVVIPTYNRDEVLGHSIDSVLAQTYEDFELIVVDDGSTDDTQAVCKAYEDDRLTYLRQANEGAAVARNTGIERARGEFVAFQDSDDVWHPEKLRKQMQVFEEGAADVGVVYTGFWRVADDGRTYVPGPGIEPKEGNVHQALLGQNFVSTQVAVVRKRCFETAGVFDERLPRFQDWELWLRLSKHFAFGLVDEPLVTAYDRPDSISNDHQALVEARKLIVRKHRDTFDTDTLAEQLFRLGHSSLKTRRTTQGRKYLLRAAMTKARPLYLACLLLSALGPDVYNRTYNAYRTR